jgi:6-phosphogluconolactonase
MAPIRARIDVSPDAESLAHRVAQWLTDLACATPGHFSVALSGGSTPRRLYQLLAGPPYREALPWDRVHWFWGDDRFVPWDHPDSNYGMARTAMLAPAPVPPHNIHAIVTTGTPAEAAVAYERALKQWYGAEELDPARPLFDIVLLGMGPDGHTASLFPEKPALEERRRWVVEVPQPGLNPQVPRVTLTFPTLESSRSTAFVAAGADKHAMMMRALAGERELPSARVHPRNELVWFIDEAAQGGP